METESFNSWPLLKAIHLIAMVTYFAGVFHIVRLFTAHRRALGKFEPDRGILHAQFTAMEKRALYYLASPALLVVFIMGTWMLVKQPALLKEPFMHAKLGVVALLIGYHTLIHRVHAQLKRSEVKWSSLQLQLFAQGATLLLFTLVVLMLMRDRLGWVAGAIGLLVIGGVIAYAVVSSRKKSSTENDA
ncbi:MAG TPA: CopD family protein [Flavobacteriales bacterium]|nr:CopD family protein [Flavobacteriales bacterium]